ncbi:MAG: hypothetical protein ACRYFV_10575 [Janthinobacterium lividum]
MSAYFVIFFLPTALALVAAVVFFVAKASTTSQKLKRLFMIFLAFIGIALLAVFYLIVGSIEVGLGRGDF